MFHKPVAGLAGIVLLLACAGGAPAQDFRVYTRIFDARPGVESSQKKDSQPKARSTSLFHAGKVYDCLDTPNQVTIFQPAHERFVVVDGPRRLATLIPFEYIENRLYQSRKSAEKKLTELQARASPQAAQLVGRIQFQLVPAFREKYAEPVLTLSSPFLTYQVKCAANDSRELIDAYLNYTDWAARLNYLVNQQALLPAPRLALDDALRRRQLLPVEVTFHSDQKNGLHLRAEHRFDWNLDSHDLKVIHHWETLLQGRDLKQVSPEVFFEPAGEKVSARR